jgi:hypothetical protein
MDEENPCESYSLTSSPLTRRCGAGPQGRAQRVL